MMKKLIALLLAALMCFSVLAGCGAKTEEPAEEPQTEERADGEFKASGEKIRFAMHPGNGAVAAYRAQKEGYFEELGLDVEIVMFQNGVLINEGFAADEVDIGINGFASVYSLSTGDYVYLGDVNAQTEYGVYANPESAVAGVKDQVADHPNVLGDKESATGMQVLAPQGTIAQITVDSYMAMLGVPQSDYEIVGMDCSAALTALMAGEGDAASLFPPYSTQALDAGFVKLAEYGDVCGCIPADVYMAKKEFVETHYDDTVLLCKAIYKAAAELEADDDLYYEDAMAFFSENGKEYSDHDMRALIDTSYFYDEAHLTEETYRYGYHETFAADNLINLGLLTEDARQYVEDSVNKQVIQDALGIDLTIGFND